MALYDILCCLRWRANAREERREIIDERSRLIPPITDQPAPIPALVLVDPAQFRERLGTIVRAKEGRMVNIVPIYRTGTPPTFSSHHDRSRISSGISSIRTRSISASEDIQDSDSLASASLPSHLPEAGTQIQDDQDDTHDRNERRERGSGESGETAAPKIVVSTPAKPIQKPIIPAFDDPNVKLSLSWGD
ncbi:hypothetical protein GYMLUDRAFT_256586 [Collybiopsis luxurians FD-317 M1]|nr:hypothetical protein GYMLUDRAFT_256586 [Collybiopsis luxurians FD-317 M1]